MAENIQEYGVSLKFKKAIDGLKKFQESTKTFNDSQSKALKLQITLQRQLNELRSQSVAPLVAPKAPPVGTPPTTPNPIKPEPKKPRPTTPEPIKPEPIKPNPATPRPKKPELVGPKYTRELKALITYKKTLERSRFLLDKAKDTHHEIAQIAMRKAIQEAKSADELKDSVSHVKAIMRNRKADLKVMKQQHFLLRRMKSSSEQFAGNMVGAFAISAGVGAIVRIGQDFEAVGNTMLAVSENAEVAGKNLQFVKEESYRLGLGLTDASKSFAKMLAARGDMSMSDTKEAFKGISEMSTLLGLRAEESNRAFMALQQMMSKGVVSSEELKLQMGEVMPNAIQLMAKAAQKAGLSIDGSVKSMMKLQQQGALVSSKVLPHFAKLMREAAKANGGLENALNSNRVAMNRMFTSMQMGSDQFFKSGFSEGLTDFFNTTAKMIKDNSVLWESLGKIMGAVLKGISRVIEYVVNPILSAFGSVLNVVSAAMEVTHGSILLLLIPLARFTPILGTAITAVGGFKVALIGLKRVAFTLAAPFLMILGTLEEIAEFLSPTGKKTLIGTNINDILGDWDTLFADIGKDGIFSTLTDRVGGHMLQKHKDRRDLRAKFWGESQTPVQIQIETKLDSEVIGREIINTGSVQDGISQKVSSYITGNY